VIEVASEASKAGPPSEHEHFTSRFNIEAAMPSVLGNLFIKGIVNSPLHPVLGSSFAVITVRGRKTGKPYSTPINVRREGDTYTIVSLRSRTWWRNLRAGAPAQLRVSGKRLAVGGEVVEGHDEVVEGLAAYFKRYPVYAKYFGIALGRDGQPAEQDLERAADERVIILLRPDRAE
jgi:deazaflavin-dependent oxidoreductase (nitroreductase family)